MADNKYNSQRGKNESDPYKLDSTNARLVSEIEALENNPQAKDIAKLYKNRRFSTSSVKEIHELLNDPNRMAKDQYKHFVKAFSKGKFAKDSRNALHFLNALKRGGKEGKRAQEMLKDLSKDSAANLTPKKEKALLKELTDLREQDIIEETARKTSSSVSVAVESADLSSRINQASETQKEKFSIDQLDPEVQEKIEQLTVAQGRIAKEANLKRDQIKSELAKQKPDEAKVAKLEAEIKDLNSKFDQLEKELEGPRSIERDYYTRIASTREAVETFFKQTGIDSRSARRIRMWMIKLTQSGSPKPVIKLKTDPHSGRSEVKEETIEIVSLDFDRSTKEIDPTSPGELNITFRNENGQLTEASYQVFKDMINAYEAYPEIGSLKELNDQVAEETHYLPLAEGNKFILTEKAKKYPHEINEFTVTNIDEENQTITIDQTVKTLDRRKLGIAVHPSLYFDRSKKTFKFGEFARFLAQGDYERTLTSEELEDSLKGLNQYEKKEIEELKVGATGKKREELDKSIQPITDKFTPPTTTEPRQIIFLDENFRQRFGYISKNPESDTYRIEAGGLVEDSGMEDPLAELGNVVPMRFVAAPRAKTALNPEQKERYSKITPAQLVKMVEKGQLTDLPADTSEDQTEEQKPKWSIDPDAELKVAAMERSDKGATDDAPDSGSDNPGNENPEEQPEQNPEDDLLKEEGPSQQKPKPKEPSPGKVYEEALPFDAINKYGGMERKSQNHLMALYKNTRFLSVDDFWELGKSMWEYYRRRFERRQKERYSSIGQELPWFAPEMRRINQASENEEVNQFKETFDQKGVYEIQERLQRTRQQDEMKAAFTVLSEKGQLRWDDIEMWRNLNRFLDPSKAIPIPSNGDPNTRVDKDDERTGFSYLQEAIDSLWGEGTYNDWYQRNKSSYASNAKNYYEEGKQLEGLQGGHGRRLAELLRQHKNGEYVDPHEFEGLILHSLEFGKSSMQNKLYYLVEGVAYENMHGRTILSFDRMAHVNSEMLAKFPLLEYICASVPRPDGKGSHRWTVDDYKKWIRDYFDEGDPMNCKPGAGVDRFLWTKVLPSEQVKNRINKAFRNGENIDHDDMYGYMPPGTEQVVTDATRSTTGSKKFFTVEGYTNAFPGFSEFIRTLAEEGNKTRLVQAVKSYVRYESIMRGRYEKQRWDEFQRLDTDTLRRQTIVSKTPPIAFINQLNEVIGKVVEAYDDPKLNEIYKWAMTETGDIHVDKGEMDKQKKVNAALKKFGDAFDKAVRSDGGDKLTAIINGSKLEGMPHGGMSQEEIAARKAQYTDEYNQL